MISRRNQFIRDFAIDAKWFLALKEIKRPLFIESLSVVKNGLEKSFADFLERPDVNPRFEYEIESISNTVWQKLQEDLDVLLSAIIQYENNKSIAIAYISKIEEIKAEVSILAAVARKDYDLFNKANFELYGDLDTELVDDIKYLLQKNNVTSIDYSLGAKPLSSPSPLIFLKAKDMFCSWPSIKISDSKQLNCQEIQSIWQNAIDALGFDWQVVLSESLHIRVNHRQRKIVLPANLTMSAKKAESLFAHEVGVHVFRRENAKRSKLQLLSVGLSGYQTAEEGLCLLREQLTLSRFYSYASFDKYLALSLATGLLDGEKKDFVSTYKILFSYYKERLLRKHPPAQADSIAAKRAWGSTYRIFRGGDTNKPGSCFYRDKIYREGNVKMWQFLTSETESIDLSLGKFDPTKQHHLDFVALAF